MALIVQETPYEISLNDGLVADAYGLRTTSRAKYSDRATNDTPSLEDVKAAFGTAAEAGSGFVGVLNPSGAGTAHLCACDGTNWWLLPMTQAT